MDLFPAVWINQLAEVHFGVSPLCDAAVVHKTNVLF